jgi:GNAT superfamily N-acetyltransferase
MPRPSVGEPSVPGRLTDEVGTEWESSVEGDAVRWRSYYALWDPPEALRDPAGGPAHTGESVVVGDRVQSILVRWSERAAQMWWVLHPETSADPPAMNVMAFDAPGVVPGTVMDNATFRSLPVRSDAQLGAYRWWPSTGEVHQMYVAPGERREGVGMALGVFAWTYAWLLGWPAQFTGGYRTDDGEAYLEANKVHWGSRTRERTHIVPPMTPADQESGDQR